MLNGIFLWNILTPLYFYATQTDTHKKMTQFYSLEILFFGTGDWFIGNIIEYTNNKNDYL